MKHPLKNSGRSRSHDRKSYLLKKLLSENDAHTATGGGSNVDA